MKSWSFVNTLDYAKDYPDTLVGKKSAEMFYFQRDEKWHVYMVYGHSASIMSSLWDKLHAL